MSKILTLCTLLLLTSHVIMIADAKAKTDKWWKSGISVILNGDNFDEIVGKDKHVIVNFYSKYSAENKNMAPEWDKLAEQFMGSDKKRDDVLVALIDGSLYETTSDAYNVTTLPEILFFFKNGETSEKYEGEKTAESMAKWIDNLLTEKSNIDDKPVEEVEPETIDTIPTITDDTQPDVQPDIQSDIQSIDQDTQLNDQDLQDTNVDQEPQDEIIEKSEDTDNVIEVSDKDNAIEEVDDAQAPLNSTTEEVQGRSFLGADKKFRADTEEKSVMRTIMFVAGIIGGVGFILFASDLGDRRRKTKSLLD